MSIVTRRGDEGNTKLMHGRTVRKTHPRVEACGTVDELNSALGLARAAIRRASFCDQIRCIQEALIILMGELATFPEEMSRAAKEDRTGVTSGMTRVLETRIKDLENRPGAGKGGWEFPGGSTGGAALHFARAVCRRAERRVCALKDGGQLENREILVYLNRLSDLLWLMARELDAAGRGTAAAGAKMRRPAPRRRR